jgi:aminopeptidase-like protein
MTEKLLLTTDHEREAMGKELHALIQRLYPICRSKTGNGVRATLDILNEVAGLETFEIPSGEPAYDWTVPKEWNATEAWVKDPSGRVVIDFRESNLHLLGYSIPVHRKMPLSELKPHLVSLPECPDWIPYCDTFYRQDWGFAMRHRDLVALPEGEYEVCIRSSLEDGHLSYGEIFVPGETTEEVLISTHTCHPSLCNDNLSGIAIATLLARRLRNARHRLSYRFVFVPGTIGSIIWLSRNEHKLARIKNGLVLACVGDPGDFTYVQSRCGGVPIDRAFAHVLEHSQKGYEIRPFKPEGYDQRQYCSPGINLPVGSMMRTPYYEFPEYHTSADDLSFVTPEALADSMDMILSALFVLENDHAYMNLSPKGEPHLGRRGLYGQAAELGLWWLLNLSDGQHSLLDIAERSGVGFKQLKQGADELVRVGLLERIENSEKATGRHDFPTVVAQARF